ncbi:MAG: hypothetical protein KBA60_07465 [Flavobacteriales bacterium]|nr:hypothetical protein [Flavobacteriales bacterium]MBP7155828.1 hypothetical protein [Flavobacteriales bacterium]HQV75724.1 hypothetical protein [Flavobacteriales bacterium]
MVRSVAIFFCLLSGLQGLPQDRGRALRFVPFVNAGPLQLDEPLFLPDGTPATITQLRFYVSQIRFFDQGHIAFFDSSCYLVDAGEPKSLLIQADLPRSTHADSISFLLGIDSLNNVSGAFGGDLDPTKGMYWTWNSGYINWKLEGTSTKCTTVKNEFQFHLGGYLPPYFNAQQVGLKVKDEGVFTVEVDVSKFFAQALLGGRCSVMSPGKDAVELAKLAASVFSIPSRGEE